MIRLAFAAALLTACGGAAQIPTRSNLRTACESARRSCEATADACDWVEEPDAPAR